MTNLAIVSDLHLDWLTSGVDRFDDVASALDEVVEHTLQKADGFLFLGDATDPDNPRAFRAVSKLIEVERTLERWGIPRLYLAGNHDVIEDGTGSTTLGPLKAAGGLVVERPSVVKLDFDKMKKPNSIEFVCLPFTALSHDYDPAEFVENCEVESDSPIVIGHLNLEGIAAGSETKDFARGRNVFFPISTVRKRWPKAVMMNGHYHERQNYRGVQVPGSLVRLTHSEEKNDPGFLVLEV